MDVPILRKLSRKSTLGFGIYADNTVQNLIDLQKKRYLRWIYFNCSKISYLDDVLKEILIPDEYIIEKPGSRPELNDKLNKLLWMKIPKINQFKINSRRKRVSKAIVRCEEKYDTIKNTPIKLQSKNHGHKTI